MTAAKSTRAARAKAPPKTNPTATNKSAAPAKAKAAAPKATAAKAPTRAVGEVKESSPDPVPGGVIELLKLYQGPLAEVSFPDVDRDILEEACETLREADEEVRRLFAELEKAQTAVAERRSEMAKVAERGLAYAKVFAGDGDLRDRVNGIDLGIAKKTRKAKAKPAKPKAEAASSARTDEPELVIEHDDEKMSA